jgi:phosphatidate cytidylyltransferase
MFTNPLDNVLLAPTVYRLGPILGVTLVVLLFAARHRLRHLWDNVLFQRWRTWAVIAPIYLLAILSGQVPTLLLVTFLTVQGLREYAQLVGLPTRYRYVLLAMGLLPAPMALLSLDAFYLLPPLLLIIATLQPLVFGDIRTGVRHLAFAALGWGYLAWFLAHLVLIHKYIEGGPGLLLAMGLAVGLSDVGAFVVGRALGRHPLAPRISPNKTREGTAGNLLGAYLGVGLLAFALPEARITMLVAALPFVIALGAVWGDLVESVIKREFETKDTGTWLPGFGGLLDRIDSLLLVAPLTYYVLRLIR